MQIFLYKLIFIFVTKKRKPDIRPTSSLDKICLARIDFDPLGLGFFRLRKTKLEDPVL